MRRLTGILLIASFTFAPTILAAGPRRGPIEVSAVSQFPVSQPGGFNEMFYSVENRSRKKTIEVEVTASVIYADESVDTISMPSLTLAPGERFELLALHVVPEGAAEGPAMHRIQAAAHVTGSKKPAPFLVDAEDRFLVEGS